MHEIEIKRIGGHIRETKILERNGVKVGIVEGYIATWDLDRGDWWGVKDQFLKGAFSKSLSDLRIRKRQVRLKDHHGRTVGGFPIETVKEDDTGLFGIGEINLEVQQGAEAYSLAKQGVLSDFSIGFSIDVYEMDEEKDIRTIKEATVWEGSIVDEPMNPYANITSVKGIAKKLADEIGVTEDVLLSALKNNNIPTHEKITSESLKDMTERDIENVLIDTGMFSRNICKFVAGDIYRAHHQEVEEKQKEQENLKNILASLNDSKRILNNRSQTQ